MAGTPVKDDEVMVYTPEEAAERIGRVVSAAWLKRKAGRREIPCSRLGKLGFTQQHLDEIVAKHQSPARKARR